MGFKVLRLSINWGRIFPSGDDDDDDDDKPNKKGLAFYDKVFDECLKYNIDPIVTLCHYEMPWNLVKKYQGFYSRKTIDFYVKYVTTCFERYKDKVKYWLTFNEINGGTMGEPLASLYGLGYMSQEDLQRTKPCTFDELKDNPEHRYAALHNEFVASALAVIKGHEINPNFMIGNMSSHLTWYPHTCNPKDILACQEKDTMYNDFCSDVQVRGEYPEYALAYFRKNNIEYSFITEADKKILKEGTIDIVSAGTGQLYKRYGFIYVDRHDNGTGDFSRSKKDSFYWYKKCIESNGEII